jgi:hypothetical protein
MISPQDATPKIQNSLSCGSAPSWATAPEGCASNGCLDSRTLGKRERNIVSPCIRDSWQAAQKECSRKAPRLWNGAYGRLGQRQEAEEALAHHPLGSGTLAVCCTSKW